MTPIPKLINLPKLPDPRGNLSFIEEDTHLPFKIRRVYWIYDVPGGEHRGGHAFRETEELIVALSGSFDMVLHDGEKGISLPAQQVILRRLRTKDDLAYD